jgi:hypothetical protein
MEGDFEDIDEAGSCLEKALIYEFAPRGLHLFGFLFEAKPSVQVDYW